MCSWSHELVGRTANTRHNDAEELASAVAVGLIESKVDKGVGDMVEEQKVG